jgi:hypothetical protein
MKQKRTLIHIGKCGGSSFSSALSSNKIYFDTITHIHQPPIEKNGLYFIATRSPISRALSAFNWRHHLIIGKSKQVRRFPGERDILRHYGTLNTLAERLYEPDGRSNAMEQGHFRSIHHLGESISFYLKELLGAISPDQIEGVVAQESLSDDAQRLLGIIVGQDHKIRGSSTPPEMLELSERARRNLNRFLADDFQCMRVLQDWGHLSQKAIDALDEETIEA